jgi:rhodanese-related sulfurtransferase
MTYFTPPPPPGVPEVTVDQLAQAQAGGAQVVDVREPDEYVTGHVAGAVLIPMAQVVARSGELARDGPVYIVCATGQRSGKAAQWYRSQGVDARNVAGGMKAWIAQGRPVVEGLDPT